jgi:hypothetical protein
MKLIRPTPVTDAVLTSTDAPEPHAAYNPATTYAVGAVVHDPVKHRLMQSVQAANTGHALTDSAWWLDIGPSNPWAMFDQSVGSLSTGTGEINVVLAPGSIDTLGVLDTDAELVTVSMTVGGSPVYSETLSTNVGGSAITDWYLYFFEPIGKQTTLIFSDLPFYPSATVSISFEGDDAGGPVSVGSLIIGRALEIGSTEAGASVGITDYSKKVTDDFGVTSVVARPWSKKMTTRCILPTANIDAMQRELAKVRSIPCLWIGEQGYDSLTIYGFYKDFSLDFAFSNIGYCSLTIEGLT